MTDCPKCHGRGKIFTYVKIVPPIPLVSAQKEPVKHDGTNPKKALAIIFGGIVLLMLSFGSHSTSSNQSQKSPDYLGSAEEKLDKGLPLNKDEQEAVGRAMGVKSAEEQAKEIEKKHGE